MDPLVLTVVLSLYAAIIKTLDPMLTIAILQLLIAAAQLIAQILK